MLEHIVAGLAEQIERRFFGKYRGFVVDASDPAQLGRLRLRVPSVLGEQVVTGWATPCLPYGGLAGEGQLFVPERDATVWVEFEEGDLEFPIWTGAFWTRGDQGSGLPKPVKPDGTQEDSVQQTPTRKILTTAKGHTIQLEDADGEEMLLIQEGCRRHLLRMDTDGIAIVDADHNTLKTSSKGVVVKDKFGNEITMGQQGILLRDLSGNVLDMSTDKFAVTSQVPFEIRAPGQPVKIVADTIDLEKG
jgi:hypothetical protein